MINLHFESAYLWSRSFDSISDKNANFCFQHSSNFQNRIISDNAKNFQKYFTQIINEFENKKDEYQLQIKNFVNMIIIELIREHSYSAGNRSLNNNGIKAIQKATEYIDCRLSEQITLSELSKYVGFSPNYLSSLFKKISGISLWDYINSRRIEKAMRLLKSNNTLNIIDISEQCGFNSTANFNKIFKKFVGKTPKEYRICSYDII